MDGGREDKSEHDKYVEERTRSGEVLWVRVSVLFGSIELKCDLSAEIIDGAHDEDISVQLFQLEELLPLVNVHVHHLRAHNFCHELEGLRVRDGQW